MKKTINKCWFSQEGLNAFGKQKQGVVVGESRDKRRWWVKWSSNKEANAYHKSFIATEGEVKFIKPISAKKKMVEAIIEDYQWDSATAKEDAWLLTERIMRLFRSNKP